MLLYMLYLLPLYCLCVAYALPSYAGQLSKGDKAQLESLFRKAFRRGFVFTHFSWKNSYPLLIKKYFIK